MQGAVRSYLTAGIGLVGAGAIALAPVSPVVPSDLEAAAAAVSKPVQLAASVNPIEAYFQLIENSAGNIGGLAQTFLSNPAPILTQIFLNQYNTAGALLEGLQTFAGDLFSNFQTIAAPELEQAFELLGSGNFTGAAPHLVAALFQPALFAALPLLPVLQSALETPVANLLAVTQQFQTIAAFGALGLLGPLSSSVYATAEAIQNVVDAASAGDPIGALGAIVAAPAIVIDGFLNGYGADGGLLSLGLGTISAFLQIRDMIAAAITPAAPEALPEATDVPSEDALTVAVSTSTGDASVENASSQTEASGSGGDATGAPATGEEAEEEESPGEEASDGTETDGTEEDGTEEDGTEEDGTDEDAAEEDGDEESGKPGGGTDLSDGNMSTPGETGDSGEESTDEDSTGEDSTEDTAPSDDGDDGAGDNGSGGSDGGGESGGDTE